MFLVVRKAGERNGLFEQTDCLHRLTVQERELPGETKLASARSAALPAPEASAWSSHSAPSGADEPPQKRARALAVHSARAGSSSSSHHWIALRTFGCSARIGARQFSGAPVVCLGGTRELLVELRVRAAQVSFTSGLGEPFDREPADRLQHPVAVLAAADEALVDERGERADLRRADRLGRGESGATAENAERGEQSTFLRLEQLV